MNLSTDRRTQLQGDFLGDFSSPKRLDDETLSQKKKTHDGSNIALFMCQGVCGSRGNWRWGGGAREGLGPALRFRKEPSVLQVFLKPCSPALHPSLPPALGKSHVLSPSSATVLKNEKVRPFLFLLVSLQMPYLEHTTWGWIHTRPPVLS